MNRNYRSVAMYAVILCLFVLGCSLTQPRGAELTPTPAATLTPEPTATPEAAAEMAASNEHWEVAIVEVYTETKVTSDLITQTRTYTSEPGSVFVVVRAEMLLLDQETWAKVRSNDLLPLATLVTEDGTTFPAVGSSKKRGDGCVEDCQILLLGEETLSEPRQVNQGFIFTLPKEAVFGKVLKFQFADLPAITLEVLGS